MTVFFKSVCGGLSLWLLLGFSTVQALTVVLTHTQQEADGLLEQFQQLHPDVKITFMNRRAELIRQGVESGSLRHADVVLTSSPFLMASLKNAGLLVPVVSPKRMGNCVREGILLGDEQHYFTSYGLAGFGLIVNGPLAKKRGLPIPYSWQDLTQPQMFGQVIMSTPSRSSSTHMMVEKVLQDEGWERGWRLLLQVAGNQKTLAARSYLVSESVRTGEALVGPVLDSSIRQMTQNNTDVQFSHFSSFAVMPAYVAVLKGGRDQAEARQLIDYLFSSRGQSDLLQGSQFKVPLSVEQDNQEGMQLCLLFRQQQLVNTSLLLAREQLVQLLYDQLITLHFEQLRDTWGLIYQVEQTPLSEEQYQQLNKARDLISTPPVSVQQAADSAYLDSLRNATASRQAELQRWQSQWQAQLSEAAQLARRVLVDRSDE